jgi:tRNA A37 N6-isopentenylltransferase MiaA
VISAEDIERAEKVLSVVYSTGGIDRQLAQLEVDLDAFDNFISALREQIHKLYPQWDPRIDPAINTMFGHGFLVGLLCGRAVKEII